MAYRLMAGCLVVILSTLLSGCIDDESTRAVVAPVEDPTSFAVIEGVKSPINIRSSPATSIDDAATLPEVTISIAQSEVEFGLSVLGVPTEHKRHVLFELFEFPAGRENGSKVLSGGFVKRSESTVEEFDGVWRLTWTGRKKWEESGREQGSRTASFQVFVKDSEYVPSSPGDAGRIKMFGEAYFRINQVKR